MIPMSNVGSLLNYAPRISICTELSLCEEIPGSLWLATGTTQFKYLMWSRFAKGSNFNKFFIKPEEVEIMFENEGKNHKQSSFLLVVLCRTQDSSALCKIMSDGRIQSCLMFSYRHTVIQSKNKNKLNWEFSIPKNSNLQIVILLSRWSWPGNRWVFSVAEFVSLWNILC